MRGQNDKFRLRQLLLSQKLLWGIAWLLGIATVLSVLGLVMLSGWFITMAGVAGVLVLGATFNYLIPSVMIRGFAIVRTFARYGDLMVSHHAVFGLLKELRVRFFARWASLPLSVRMNRQDVQSSSETMQRLVRDIDILDELPLRLISPFIVATLAVGVLSVLILLVLPTALFTVLCLLASLLVALWTLKQGVRLAERESILLTQKKSKLLDTLPALTALLTWNRWQEQVATLSAQDEAYAQTTRQAMRLRRNRQALIQVIIAIASVALLMVAGSLFDGQAKSFVIQLLSNQALTPTPAVVLALLLGLLGLIEILLGLVGEPLAWGRSLLAKTRINTLIDGESIPQKQSIASTPTIHLHGVSVKMPKGLMATTNINGVLTPTKPTLIVGASGAGKSTLLATLAGEIARVGGEILVNGVDIDAVDFGSSLGYLGQNVDIFDQTLADNLRLGKPSANDDELWSVLDKVGLLDWAKSQPKGLDTPLGEYGTAISGGQGRRVALARLLLAPKAVLLLDEPFAGLDQSTRQTVWHSLVQLQTNGQIGVLAIATHQIGDEMSDINIMKVGQ
ncbi:ATP-binding cassette domain-containing protein [Moraxella haemolytica]|uniref:amino acid ABC transporter ATP-binding/permease protein n=1 Tax=Moraxella haemolytica TaxID=2904119 RepID=UPI0025431FD2|nr:ATP-binding cassette domain-containing protein [Moraxella sp. ZY171148]WII94420.1 ATP-binding cassette domain-containing protein [Moraxella sp. ZY171148]